MEGAKDDSTWTMETARDFVDRFAAAWAERRFDDIGAMLTDDTVFEDPGIMPSGEARGRTAVLDWLRSNMSALPDLHFATTGVFLSTDRLRIIWEWRMTGTFLNDWVAHGITANGRRVDVRGTDMMEFRGSQVAYLRSTWDSLTAFRQMNIGPGAA